MRIHANGLEFEVETAGRRDDDPLILIAGLSGQLTSWRSDFVGQLCEAGFFVIRFDNRDIGLSSRVPERRPGEGKEVDGKLVANYTLWDMAGDTKAILNALGLRSAHVVGASMGGMIAQCMAIRYPEAVLSLTSIMSTTGNPNVGHPKSGILEAILKVPPQERDEWIEHQLELDKLLRGSGFEKDDQDMRSWIAEQYDRAHDSAGVARQTMAILATEDRTEMLHNVKVPTLIIHGEDDPLIGISGGHATAESIPNVKTLWIKGMGHDLPTQTFPQIVQAIKDIAGK